MALLVATDVTVRGGVDRYVLDLIGALRATRHRVVLLLERTTTSQLRSAQDAYPDLPVRLAPLYHRRHELRLLRGAAAAVLHDLVPAGLHVVGGSPRSCLASTQTGRQRSIVHASLCHPSQSRIAAPGIPHWP